MTVKELITTHARVAEPWTGIDVSVVIFAKEKERGFEQYSIDDAIKEYGQNNVVQWYETTDTTDCGQLVQINILV